MHPSDFIARALIIIYTSAKLQNRPMKSWITKSGVLNQVFKEPFTFILKSQYLNYNG